MKKDLSTAREPKKNALLIIMLVLLSIKNIEAGIFNILFTENVTSFRPGISGSTVVLLGFGNVLNLFFYTL